ncbi:glycoside hydrolase family 2 protein [Paenibacillus sp. JDR-2]|uniref:glycoside hydrolase family 2 protein n=1 Tax=Paenibacillus sp. (strain JDR-2) TaxID=324057 RepID=UPI0001664914|nr:glycoside hydrolase family 2 [Paenibacillus sp. JDR-2]ACT03745.1 glycoside hydrolase family 2 sugar binding [Paenibacillus sp. JDR-2]
MASTHKYVKDYPRPQWVRDEWQLLNGEWGFRFDDSFEGERSKWYSKLDADRTIQVPFTYETKASGIGEETFHPCVWYERNVAIPEETGDKRVILHFQAVDYLAKLWVNGMYIGSHEGGYAAFSFDITDAVQVGGDNRITLRVEDSNSTMQPRGKQRWIEKNYGCWYVQTTGIWQSVWLEYVDGNYVDRAKITPKLEEAAVTLEYELGSTIRSFDGLTLQTVIRYDGNLIRSSETNVDRKFLKVELSVMNDVNEWKIHSWHPNHPNLYDVEIILKKDGQPVDTVYSYFGMRRIQIKGDRILLNKQPLYQRLLLDQGYWEDTHLTPPSEEAIIEDIDKTLALGFNGVRKHQKLEDPRYLYWADRKGLLVWSEIPATYEFGDDAVERFTKEWMEVVRQHYNHPSIVTWVPFNESWGIGQIFTDRKQQQFTESIYHLTKSYDQMRPVVVNDGWEHTISDIITLHDYEELGSVLEARYKDKDALLSNDFAHDKHRYPFANGYSYKGQPVIISEYGGIAFTSESGWGYGNQVKNEEDFLVRYEGITQAIKNLEYVSGFCYTQITDVQQEVNGLLTINREPKIAMEKIRKINLQ